MPGTKAWGDSVFIPFSIDATDLSAGTSRELIAPIGGIIKAIYSTVQVAISTGGVLTVQVGTTDVVGASITVANSATKGTVQSASSTSPSTTRTVAKGDRVQVTPSAAFNGGGAINGFIEFATGE